MKPLFSALPPIAATIDPAHAIDAHATTGTIVHADQLRDVDSHRLLTDQAVAIGHARVGATVLLGRWRCRGEFIS